MIGTVEIFENFGTSEQNLLHKESNLIVNGAGESICDLLTTPSGCVSGFEGHGSSITDTSNFTIQAISFGKSSEGYRKNAHFYPFNLSSYIGGAGEYSEYISVVQADNVVRAVSMVNENITSTPSSYDPLRDPGSTPNVNDRQLEPNTETAIDLVSGQYHTMGSDLMQGRAHAQGQNLNRVQSLTNPNLLSYTTNPNSDPNTSGGGNDANLTCWTSSTGVQKITLLDTNTGPNSNTSAILVSGTGAATVVLRQELPLQNAYFNPNVDHTFSTYVNLPEENPASSITLMIRDGEAPRNYQVVFSMFNTDTNSFKEPEVYSDTNRAKGSVTPIGSVDGSSGWYRLEARLEGLGGTYDAGSAGTDAKTGHRMHVRTTFPKVSNEKPAALNLYGWQLEESYGATEYKEVLGLRPTFKEGGLAGDIFLGCYPESTGTDFAIVSSISNLSTPQDNIIISGTYPSKTTNHPYFNSSSVRSMDQNGFVRAYNSYLKEGTTIKGPTSQTASGVIITPKADFSSMGEVVYTCTVASADLGLANMYGGIFKLGLWTIDLEKTLSNISPEGNPKTTPPFPLRFSAGYNKIVYKLFAEKSLTKNLCAIQDAGVEAGCKAYKDLTIVWTINFVGTLDAAGPE